MAVESKAAGTGRRRLRTRAILLAVVAMGLIGGGWNLLEMRRYRRDMAEIKREIQAGRHGHAAQKLTVLLASKPDLDEAAYLLGTCEKARGQARAAFQAWERVAPGSPFGAKAIRARMDLLIERGRLSDAEDLIIRTTADPRVDSSGLRLFLGMVYSLQGRVEEGERVIEECWDRLNDKGEGASEMAILLVRLHIQLWRESPKKEGKLDRADELRPKKTELDRLRSRYETLYNRNQTIRDAGEMASLAERLGRAFEAKALKTIAIGVSTGEG